MDIRTFRDRIVAPGLGWLHVQGGPEPSPEAERFLLAIAQQESGQSLKHRYQVLRVGDPSRPGRAKGWWQFERSGGVAGVLGHPATKRVAEDLCALALCRAGQIRSVACHRRERPSCNRIRAAPGLHRPGAASDPRRRGRRLLPAGMETRKTSHGGLGRQLAQSKRGSDT